MGAEDGGLIFRGISDTYDRVARALSFGQDPRWREAAVRSVGARPSDMVLDVATGTGLVAQALHDRYGCRVVGLDQSPDMLSRARDRAGVYEALVEGRAEALPFPDASFDHLTFTYLLRYVDDPAATMRELARVVKPGGRLAMVEFGVPGGPWRPLWWLYTRLGLPLLGRTVSRRWWAVGRFLGPSISSFWRRNPAAELERYWREAGLADVTLRSMSLGGGVVMTARKLGRLEAEPQAEQAAEGGVAAAAAEGRVPMAGFAAMVAPVLAMPGGAAAEALAGPAITSPTEKDVSAERAPLLPAFYARRGRLMDYWTLLHPPYTIWHLSYVLLGAAVSPAPDPRIVAGALLAFGLAIGLAAHSFDELKGRPLRTRIPEPVLILLGTVSLAGAVWIGLVGATMFGPEFLVFVVLGAGVVVLYGFEVPMVHSDAGFALGWGGLPVAATAYATGAHFAPAIVAATGATLLSLAQRRLSTRARSIRRRAVSVSGRIVYADGSVEELDARGLIEALEAALSALWVAILAISAAVLMAHWI